VDLEKIRELGRPFWLAGGVGSPNGLCAALEAGAAGVQVGTLFAYCDESGLASDVKARVLSGVRSGGVRIQTDPRASPTGYPFKVVVVDGLDSQDDTRVRVCDLGYLRTPYAASSGRLGYRCPAEPIDSYVEKGGDIADTVGRRCLCNGLAANIGHPQRRDEVDEKPLVTSGDDLVLLDAFLRGRQEYTAADVITHLLSEVHNARPKS
jgi:NAD(P)H-dependent flavin oxidoreductase YrpB (nitropropane dioxygenase family)